MSNRTELHDKIQQITAKIIDLNISFADKPALNKLDTDLLQKYTVDLYDVILQLQTAPNSITNPVVNEPVVQTTVPAATPVPQPEPEKQPEVNPEPPKVEVELPPVTPQPVMPPPVAETPVAPLPVVEVKPEIVMPAPQVEEKPVPPVFTPEPVTQPVVPVVEKAVIAEKEELSLNDRHTTGESHDLASKMQQTPIHDLKKAISINKKFEFINQLFKGDHEAYAKSIHYINGLTNGAEANTFFNNLRKQFGWEEENKLYIELADMVRRRFM